MKTPSEIVRAYVTLNGLGVRKIFSDRIKSWEGMKGYSIKVWGFAYSDYVNTQMYLRQHGYMTEIIQTFYGNLRIRAWIDPSQHLK